MVCIFITASGEYIDSLTRIRDAGYIVRIYTATEQCTGFLRDTIRPITGGPDSYTAAPDHVVMGRKHVQPLRESWAKLLIAADSVMGDTTIFCESDAFPIVSSSVLEEALKKDMEEHPDVDVWRMHDDVVLQADPQEADNSDVTFKDAEWSAYAERDANTPEVWGTHALVIPSRSRAKVASLFTAVRMPVDCTLEYAVARGIIKMRYSTRSLFVQKRRVPQPKRDMRIACLLASYKRPRELQRQIYTMMNQTYTNFHLFVSAKGIIESVAEVMLYRPFDKFIKDGRLTIRLTPNKDQVHNLLDCLHGVDLDKFDLFAKIDDDDLYDPEYLQTAADFHRMVPPDVVSFSASMNVALRSVHGYHYLCPRSMTAWGPTMVFPRWIVDVLRKATEDPDFLLEDESMVKDLKRTVGGLGLAEDLIIHKTAAKANKYMNRAIYAGEKHKRNLVFIGEDLPSVTRGGLYEDDEAFKTISDAGEEVRTIAEDPDYALMVLTGRNITLLRKDPAAQAEHWNVTGTRFEDNTVIATLINEEGKTMELTSKNLVNYRLKRINA